MEQWGYCAAVYRAHIPGDLGWVGIRPIMRKWFSFGSGQWVADTLQGVKFWSDEIDGPWHLVKTP